MAQNGMFRNAFRGFNKQDVLQYIDEITAAWDQERKELEQKAEDAVAAQQAAQAAADEAQALAAAAVELQQTAQVQLAEAQQQLASTAADLSVAATTIEEMATQLEEEQRRMALLEQELTATASERDNAIAALADAKEQLTDAQTTRQQLEECRRQLSRQEQQIAEMGQTIRRYESVLGDADTAAQKVSDVIRPCIRQTADQADEALHDTQNFLTGLICQLSEMNDELSGMRGEIQKSAADSDARLSAVLNDWLSAAQDGDGQGSGFFR